MNTSRAATQSRVQSGEDCGVWLDTVKLKGKVQKKRSARPISKLLNPFADGAGYNVAVALNFTQTKMEMPKTKQSSISNFFTCQGRVLKKNYTSGRQNEGVQEASSTRGSVFNNETPWCDVDCNQERNAHLTEPQAAVEDEESNPSSLPNVDSDYKGESSMGLRQFMNKSNLQASSTCDIGQESSQGSLHCNHESNFRSSLPAQSGCNAFGALFNAEGRISTQKTCTGLSWQNDKENTTPKYSKTQTSDLQVQMLSRQTKLKPLLKHFSLETCTQDEGFNSPMKWTKPKNSPVKNQKFPFRDGDDESLSMLFTQDSQGFRVIAHRGLQTLSPLKDQSNIIVPVPSAVTSQEEEMLFTQDSQGNMVIKH